MPLFSAQNPYEVISRIIIFKLEEYCSRSEIIHSGESEKLKNNSVLGRFYDWNRFESEQKTLGYKCIAFSNFICMQ